MFEVLSAQNVVNVAVVTALIAQIASILPK
jgi:hypothetical protein